MTRTLLIPFDSSPRAGFAVAYAVVLPAFMQCSCPFGESFPMAAYGMD